MAGALLPNERDNRERHMLGNADVLMEPHPRERRTWLVSFIELLDHVRCARRSRLRGAVRC